MPIYLDRQAAARLSDAQGNFALTEAGVRRIIATGDENHLIAIRKGSDLTSTLAPLLRGLSLETTVYDAETKEVDAGVVCPHPIKTFGHANTERHCTLDFRRRQRRTGCLGPVLKRPFDILLVFRGA